MGRGNKDWAGAHHATGQPKGEGGSSNESPVTLQIHTHTKSKEKGGTVNNAPPPGSDYCGQPTAPGNRRKTKINKTCP